MISFNETSFTITVECGSCPMEDWLTTHDELIGLLQAEDSNMQEKRYHTLELLRQMMPSFEQAKKMMLDKK